MVEGGREGGWLPFRLSEKEDLTYGIVAFRELALSWQRVDI
jgi:hypothetical protein